MRFLSLGSGSKGNATLVEAGDTRVLVDCGFTRQECERRLAEREIDPCDLDAVLVTHEHGDHAGGVGAIARAWQLPVYSTHGTISGSRLGKVPVLVTIDPGQQFALGDMVIEPVAVPHDAREPVQFVFEWQGSRLGILTDLGSVSRHVVERFGGCDALLLEFNHDLQMLRDGPYPQALKRRVGGDWGHLNNEQAVSFLEASDTSRLHTLVVGHISEQNNSVSQAAAALSGCVAVEGVDIVYAEQGSGFDWLDCVRPEPNQSALGATA